MPTSDIRHPVVYNDLSPKLNTGAGLHSVFGSNSIRDLASCFRHEYFQPEIVPLSLWLFTIESQLQSRESKLELEKNKIKIKIKVNKGKKSKRDKIPN
jgi:hypothetical protein